MNNLNSVLIEGEIADVKRKNGEIFLDIVNKRKEGHITIPVQIGFTLNNPGYNNLQVKEKVRIVGKLAKANFPGVGDSLAIFAEHMEFCSIRRS